MSKKEEFLYNLSNLNLEDYRVDRDLAIKIIPQLILEENKDIVSNARKRHERMRADKRKYRMSLVVKSDHVIGISFSYPDEEIHKIETRNLKEGRD